MLGRAKVIRLWNNALNHAILDRFCWWQVITQGLLWIARLEQKPIQQIGMLQPWKAKKGVKDPIFMLLRGPYDIEHLNIQTSILIQGWQWETEPSRKLYTTSTEQPSCTGLFEGSKNGSIFNMRCKFATSRKAQVINGLILPKLARMLDPPCAKPV